MSKDKKTKEEGMKKQLFYHKANAWDKVESEEKDLMESYCSEYKEFLNDGKTEREAVRKVVSLIEPAGYKDLNKKDNSPNLFLNHLDKSIAIYRPGKKSVLDGLNILVSHLDAPRLDLKQNPLYEDLELSFLKTHYYGGIKKYQWVSRPLAIHGKICFQDGSSTDIVIGEDPDDPVFTIADLLPHLAKKAQMSKNASEFIPGEKLNILFGTVPFPGDEKTKDRVKLNILDLLNQKYGIIEEDFVSADIEVVPAGEARDIGLDRSMIGSYGQDDRVCSFAALKAVLNAEELQNPALILLMDKEEIGSEGASGSNTWFVEMVVDKILALEGKNNYAGILKVLSQANCLSADVKGATHPDWVEVYEKRNAFYMSKGMVLAKFTGHGGKYSASEANAEFIARVRSILNDSGVVWHIAESGKVDEGGGGTIAKFMAYYGMQVLDAGVPLLDMHSPFEIVSKVDMWMMYKGFKAFLERN